MPDCLGSGQSWPIPPSSSSKRHYCPIFFCLWGQKPLSLATHGQRRHLSHHQLLQPGSATATPLGRLRVPWQPDLTGEWSVPSPSVDRCGSRHLRHSASCPSALLSLACEPFHALGLLAAFGWSSCLCSLFPVNVSSVGFFRLRLCSLQSCNYVLFT